ncbi:MAG TPA: MFS transporter [Nocardioidaceae bacterium]|nr:MFS transporter [Nocardioidaceae bacterium]
MSQTSPALQATPRRVAVASAVGATIEWYDFFLYGTAAGLVFDKLFFNGLSGPAAQFAAFATFAVGFLARPLGGFVFGHFGDRIGRKKMLLATLLIMGVGTAAIGLLPSYDAIGIWAPVLLVTLRILQGIGVGGEYGGAVLLAVEYAPARRRGFYGSFAHIGVPGGLLLASGAFSLASLLPDEAFLAWGWRACFLISVLLLAVGAYIRLSVMETPAFARVQERKEVSRLPLRDLLASQPKRLLLGMGTRYIEGFTFNFFSVYLLAYVVTNLGLPKTLALNGILVGAALGVVLVPLTGALSDRLGRKPVYRFGAWLALLFAFPVAALVHSSNHVAVFLVFVAGLGLLYGTVYGPLAAFWSELFDTRYRYTALSTLYQVSGVVASGLTPLIAAWLVTRGDGSLWWVAAYNAAVAAVSLTCARFLPETRGNDLDEVTSEDLTSTPVPAAA